MFYSFYLMKWDGRDLLDLKSSYLEQWLNWCSQVKAQHEPISNCLLWAAFRTEPPSSMFSYYYFISMGVPHTRFWISYLKHSLLQVL